MLRLTKVLSPALDVGRLLRLPGWRRSGEPAPRRSIRFDPRTASDHLRRDLGLADGRRIGRSP